MASTSIIAFGGTRCSRTRLSCSDGRAARESRTRVEQARGRAVLGRETVGCSMVIKLFNHPGGTSRRDVPCGPHPAHSPMGVPSEPCTVRSRLMRNPAILLAVVLTACGAPEYRSPPVPVPAQFREPADTGGAAASPNAVPSAFPPSVDSGPAAAARAAAEAWRVLGDTTLDRLLAELASANLDVRAAEARVRGARSLRSESSFDLAPTITLGGGYTRQRISAATFPLAAQHFPDQGIWDAGFDAAWELDLFGRLRKNIQAQGAFVAVAQEDLRNLQVSLTAELARAYFELRGAPERLAVARRNAENQQRTYQLTKDRLDAGRGTAFDTERAQAQLSFTLASIPALESAVSEAQYQVGVLVGRPPAVVAAELKPAPLPALPAPTAIASADSVLRRRPDVAAAERQVAAEDALVGRAK